MFRSIENSYCMTDAKWLMYNLVCAHCDYGNGKDRKEQLRLEFIHQKSTCDSLGLINFFIQGRMEYSLAVLT